MKTIRIPASLLALLFLAALPLGCAGKIPLFASDLHSTPDPTATPAPGKVIFEVEANS